MSVAIGTLLERLAHERVGVRRLAAIDLHRVVQGAIQRDTPIETDADTLAIALTDRVRTEPDHRTRIALIRTLGRLGSPAGGATLVSVRDDPCTPADVAHAALLACDAIELAQRDRAGIPKLDR